MNKNYFKALGAALGVGCLVAYIYDLGAREGKRSFGKEMIEALEELKEEFKPEQE